MEEKPVFYPRSFAVVGAGPVGCIVAAFLTKGGYDVTFCDVMTESVEPASEPGITIEGAENLQQRVNICTHIEDLASYHPDVIIITVKAYALPLLASAIEGLYREGAVVVSWQNGIDTELELAKVLGKKRVLRAVVNYGCTLIGPCRVWMPFHHPPHFVQELDPESLPAAVAIADSLSKCGLSTHHTEDIISLVWKKSILNASMNPVCAVTGMTMAQVMHDPIVFQIIDALIKECVKIARANEIKLGWDFYPYCIEYMRKAGDHKPSMLVDIEKGRKTEIDYINGKFVEYGRQAGIETPYNTTFRALVKALEPK